MFCSFGCMVVQAAPGCPQCGAKVLGRGYVAGGKTYCGASCASRDAVTAG